MTTEFPTRNVTDAPLVPELRDVAAALLGAGFGVYYYSRNGRDLPRQTWVVIERGGNIGTVQYDRLTGYGVNFEIKPSRETGSSLMVYGQEHDDPADPATVQALVLAAGLATQDTYKNFATPVALPNYGWKSVEWARDRLTQLTDGRDGACQHCGKPGGHGPGDTY